jgi:hypothetical protein
MKQCLLLALLATEGCVAPGYVFHTYRFEGRVLNDVTGDPIAGAAVSLEAKTDPFEGTAAHRGKAMTAADGTFEIEIVDGWCHSCWICPPLGILGGSGMNTLETIRLQLGDGPSRTAHVQNREEPSEYTILHQLGDIRVPP